LYKYSSKKIYTFKILTAYSKSCLSTGDLLLFLLLAVLHYVYELFFCFPRSKRECKSNIFFIPRKLFLNFFFAFFCPSLLLSPAGKSKKKFPLYEQLLSPKSGRQK